jgi:hypothetical protein
MRISYPKAADALVFFPFSEAEHIAGKERLMQRWVSISPWMKLWIQSSLVLPTPEQLKNRLENLRSRLSPVTRHVFVNVPEHTPITNAHNEDYYAELKRVFIGQVRAIGFDYVDVDYAKCGLSGSDFWKGWGNGGGYGIDPVHLNSGAPQVRMTECLVRELKAHGSF